jgi:DUF971 family protein
LVLASWDIDDGHNTGLYTWKYLYELGQSQHSRWAEYLRRYIATGITEG